MGGSASYARMGIPAPPAPGATLREGVIQGAAVSGRVKVVVPSVSPDYAFGDCPVEPHGATYPSGGEKCLLAYGVDLYEAWVVSWYA